MEPATMEPAVLEPLLQPFCSPASPKNNSPAPEDQLGQETSFSHRHQGVFVAGKPRDSGIEESLLGSIQQRKFSYSNVITDAAVIPEGDPSPESSGSNSSPGFLNSHCSTLPVSNHEFSEYSSDNVAEGGGGGGGAEGGISNVDSHYMMPVQVKRKGKRRKSSSEHSVEEMTEKSFTQLAPSHTYKWFTGPPNKLNNKKNLKAREMTVWKNKQKKSNTKLRSEVEILPNVTEPSNERVAKMGIRLTVEMARLEEYECTASVDVSLYDPHTQDTIVERQERRKFTGGFVQFFTTLGLQERIERNPNKLLDLTIGVKLHFQQIGTES